MKNKMTQVEDIEVSLFIEAVRRKSGYDFSAYSENHIKRRILQCTAVMQLSSVSELTTMFLHEDELAIKIIDTLCVNVTELFRDPFVFQCFQKQVLSYLRSFQDIDIWIAGCSTGEEAFSLLILLEEYGLLERVRLYATDISSQSLEATASGLLTKRLNANDALRYRQAGGKDSLSRYFISAYGKQKLAQHLLDHLCVHHHNLLSDTQFCSAHLLLCRNVLIYFNDDATNRVQEILKMSIVPGGFLTIGPKESLRPSIRTDDLICLDRKANVYHYKPCSS